MPRAVAVQRALGVVVAVVLAIGAVYAFRHGSDAAALDARATSTSVNVATSATSATSVTPPIPTSPPSLAATADTVASNGPGVTEPGIHVLAQPNADGSLEVVEQIKLRTPVGGLSVALPHASASGMAGANITIKGFQAQADGLVVTDTPASPLPAGGDRLDLPSPATDISMRYRLEGDVDRSHPAPVGRVLMVLPPITAADLNLGDPLVVVEVVGGSIRNLVCPNLPVSDQLCGRQHGRVWSTTAIPLSSSLVIAQVDLPPPGVR